MHLDTMTTPGSDSLSHPGLPPRVRWAAPSDDPRTRSTWHPGVRLILVLVVLLPMLSTAILLALSGSSAWSFRQRGQIVAGDAARLQIAARARAQLNALEVPLSAVSYAAQVGVSESTLMASSCVGSRSTSPSPRFRRPRPCGPM